MRTGTINLKSRTTLRNSSSTNKRLRLLRLPSVTNKEQSLKVTSVTKNSCSCRASSQPVIKILFLLFIILILSLRITGAAREQIEFIGCEDDATEEAKWADDNAAVAGTLACKTAAEFTDANPLNGSYAFGLSANIAGTNDAWNRSIDLSGYTDVNITMFSSTEDTEAADNFTMYYWNGSTWVFMWEDLNRDAAVQTAWTKHVNSIPDSAATSNFKIQVRWETSADSEHMIMDNINVTGEPVVNWANSSFDRCKDITITNSGSETLNNFPAYINLTHDSDMLSDFSDIRFYNAECSNGGTELDYEIENYTTSTRAHVWVRIPSLTSAGTTISVYYKNNTGVSSGENASGVWESSYKGVWHMTEANAVDSTSNQNNGTAYNNVALTSSGRIDGADDFDGDNDYINVSDSSSLDITDEITLSAWIYIDSAPNAYPTILGKASTTSVAAFPYNLFIQNNGRIWFCQNLTSSATQTCLDTEAGVISSTGTWYYLTATYNGTHQKIYLNGLLNDTQSDSLGTMYVTTEHFIIGNDGTLTYDFNGTIDEVRIENTSRSASWINMSYLIVANHFNFVSYGTEEERPITDTTAPTVNINTSLNNTEVNDATPSVDFNFTDNMSSTANCALYFNDTAYDYITGINNNSQTTLTVNTSISNGRYDVYINCTDESSNIGKSDVLNISVQASWANNSFEKCKDITITNVGSTTLTNFPAYINLTYDNSMQTNFDDIRFYDEACNEGGSLLDYEIENYTASTRAHIWVGIPSLTSSGKTISVYYKNNTGVSNGENPTGVWDDYFSGVWHMTETDAEDSTQYGNNGTENGGITATASGRIDSANDFDMNRYSNIIVPDDNEFDINETLTLEVWIKPINYSIDPNSSHIISKWDPSDTPSYLLNLDYWKGINFFIRNESGSYPHVQSSGSIPLNSWTYVAATYNSSVPSAIIYVNDNTDSTGTITGKIRTGSANVTIGTRGDGVYPFNGTIDEVRISNTTRSADWINMTYQIVENQATIVSFGDEESKPVWANTSFDRCKDITITNSGSETLTNFPAYINLTWDDDMQADFDDIRFYNASCDNGGSLLDYEIENYTASTRAHVWVRIQSLTSSGKTISVYYKNNTGVGSGENPTGVWNSNYMAVWHMTETNAIDSTIHQNNGTGTDVTQIPGGRIDGGNNFTGIDNAKIELVDNETLDIGTHDFTVEAWVKRATIGTYDSMVVKRQTGAGLAVGFTFNINSADDLNLEIANGSVSLNDGSFSTAAAGNWYYVVAVMDRSGDATVYSNGDVNFTFDISSFNGQDLSTTTVLRIGLDESNAREMNGTVDEIRISNSTRSANWINMTYYIVANHSDYVNYGDEEEQPTTGDTTAPVVNINTSLNNTVTTDPTPSIDFNFTDSESGTANCTLYFDSTGYNYTTGINNNSQTTLTVNTSLNDANYSVYISCTDNSSNTGTSDILNIEIDTTAPVITNVINWSITITSAKVNWTTNEPANGSVSYGTTTALSDGTSTHSDFITAHNVSLSGLSVNTFYYYNITSCDAQNLCNTTGPYNFTTLEGGSCTAPASGDWNVNCSHNCAWTTDQDVPANMTTNDSGQVKLSANLTFTSTSQFITINSGCTFEIKSGGEIRKGEAAEEEEEETSWANTSFDRCMNITISNIGAETLTNFPAYINLTYDNDMQADFKDIRFYNASCNNNGTEMDYEIENYTTSTRAHIWVRIPSLTSSGKTISIYYDNNTGVSSGENPTGVWNSNYKGVWHMTEPNATDSTSNNNDGNQSGGVALTPSGRIDGADDFYGDNDYINGRNDSGLQITGNITVSGWAKRSLTDATNATSDILVSYTSTTGYKLQLEDDDDVRFFYGRDAVPIWTEATDTDWHMWTGVYNGTHLILYKDGVFKDSKANSSLSHAYSGNLTIGTDTSQYFNGTIDEVRISNSARSPDWINMTYQIVASQGSIVSFDDEESRTPWADSQLDRCMNITITNSGAETLTNFPAYINLTHDNNMLADFVDIRFYNTSCNNSGTQLDYEIEDYTASSRADVWVKIPSLTSSGLTISVYYDNNSAISSSENPSSVWSNNYSAVWHMSEVNITDSTGAVNDGNETGGVSQITGMIDGANDFNTTNYITVPGFNIPNETGQRTVMGWVKLNDKFSNTTGRGIMRNMEFTGGGDDYGMAWIYRYDDFYYYMMNSTGYRHMDKLVEDPADDTWYHITLVHDSTNVYIYVNGVLNNTYGCIGSRKGENFQFATYKGDVGNSFNGSLDEFRISNITRSANWINQSYLLMYNQSGYVSISNEVAK